MVLLFIYRQKFQEAFSPREGWLAKHTEVPLEYWTFAEDQTH